MYQSTIIWREKKIERKTDPESAMTGMNDGSKNRKKIPKRTKTTTGCETNRNVGSAI